MIRSFSGRHLTEQMHDSVHYPSSRQYDPAVLNDKPTLGLTSGLNYTRTLKYARKL